MDLLQWGLSLAAEDIAAPLSYSVFNDLEGYLRAVPGFANETIMM